MGWDNYSSYFNLKDQLFRTFFATWRDHRGLGVPSDSESTDIFRQLFFLLVRPFGLGLSDQLYFITSLWLGVLGMYVFVKHIATDLLDHILEERTDLFAFIASFFYLFNLNTLSVYFFPIQPYNTRFFAIPIVFLFFRCIFKNKFTIKQYILILLLVFFSSTAYVIGTVFVTLMIAIALYSVWSVSLKKAVTVIIFFLFLNAFWLLPFTNYTIQKSQLIRLAPTFISANESQLNKQKSFYSFTKQLALYPNFFETEYSSPDLAKKSFLHPLATTWNTFPTYFFIAIFPILYLIGSALLLFNYKKTKAYLWISSIIALFLFLSMKEFSPLGFLYSFFDDHIPLFGVLFRFGDTKFHPFIAFTGSIAAGYAFIRVASKKVFLGLLVAVIIATVFVFRSYFSGQLIGFFMYNKVPDAYFKIAETINNDPGEGRVLHLPYDKDIYWRSYKWGYLGSEFLGFMLRKPLIEKTFEPASMENAYFLKGAYDVLNNIQSIQTSQALDSRASQFYFLLQRAGVEYTIVDQTVSAENLSREAVFWGTYNASNAHIILNRLQELGLARAVQTEYVGADEIILYKLNETESRVSFIQNVRYFDPLYKNVLEQFPDENGSSIVQDSRLPYFDSVLFTKQNSPLSMNGNTVSIETNIPQGAVNIVQKGTSANRSHLVRVTVVQNDKEALFSFYFVPYPTLNGNESVIKIGELSVPNKDIALLSSSSGETKETFVNNWHALPGAIGQLRIRVGDTLLPVPSLQRDREVFVGDVIVHGEEFKATLLGEDRVVPVSNDSFSLTSDPNCFKDKLGGYTSSLVKGDNLTIFGKDGSVCFWSSLSAYVGKDTDSIELSLDMDVIGQDGDADNPDIHATSAKPVLESVIRSLPKPNSTEVCIREGSIDECLNNHSVIFAGDRRIYRFTVDKPVGLNNDLSVLLALKNSAYQSMEMHLYSAKLTTYTILGEGQMVVPGLLGETSTSFNTDTLKMTFTKPMSKYAFYSQAGVDGFYLPSSACDKESSYRTNRLLNNTLVSWAQNCQMSLFEQTPFSSENFYLWSLNYNLASGQFPTFVLDDGFHSYINGRVSLDQGYPDIPEFKSFQRPELISTAENVRTKLEGLVPRYAYTYLYPSAGFDDYKNKNFTLEQYTENEGLMLINGFDVIELPTDWQNLQVISNQSRQTFDVPLDVRYNRILPSLWKVDMVGEEGQKYLLKFNNGFDTQWIMSGSATHVRCNGLANCFEVQGKEGKHTYYIFYWPEVLNLLGWLITIGALSLSFRYIRFSHRESE